MEKLHKEQYKELKNEIIERHSELISYYEENIDSIANLLCETIENYDVFYGYYYDINGNVGFMYRTLNGEIKTHIID